MEYQYILTEVHGGVGLVTLNRPEAMNALSHGLLKELMDALEAFEADPQVNAMVIAGSQKAFAAGADIKEMADRTAQEMRENDPIGQFGRITGLRKPVIAAVSGWALGGGCELALSCDMIVASETARFGQPEVTIGVIPGAGGTQRLTRAVGKYVAMEMILNNRVLGAHEALSLGMVNRVVPAERFLEEALSLAAAIAGRAPLAAHAAKRMINESQESGLDEGLTAERRAFYDLFDTQDQKEGMRAFVEKRKPEWTGK
ncbi:MAG TPA: enoyl-CoA hydratase-related protein [Anaerolineales bacterium]